VFLAYGAPRLIASVRLESTWIVPIRLETDASLPSDGSISHLLVGVRSRARRRVRSRRFVFRIVRRPAPTTSQTRQALGEQGLGAETLWDVGAGGRAVAL
jgi:hypothetical protein